MSPILGNRKQNILSLAILLFLSYSVIAQTTVSGTVTTDGQPLPGVNVVVKGTTNGQNTDFDGRYTITASATDTLVFSYLGFKSQEILIGSQSQIDVVLMEDLSELDEIVLVGYGTLKKKEVTGAVAKVDSEVILRTPVSDVSSTLQGQVAGVNVQAASGRPGEAANIQIRGLGSINPGSLGPLWVVDGIPYTDQPVIAPEQIESVDILKDGAAASVYGTRASNGVILVTTKRGKTGELQVDFSTYGGVQNITSGTPLMNTRQQMYAEEVRLEAAGLDPLIFFFQPDALDYDTDFVDQVQNDNAPIINANLDLRGGTENLKLFFNTNYFRQDGVLVNSGFERVSTRLTGEFTKGKFKAFASLGITREEREQEPFALYEYAIAQVPWQPGLDQLEPAGENGVEIPVRNAILYSFLSRELQNIDERNVSADNAALNLSYEFIPGLSYQLRLGYNSWDYRRKFFRPQYLVYDGEGEINPTASRPQALLNEDYIWTNRQTLENIVTYNKSFGKHNFILTGVLSYEKFESKTVGTGVIFSEDASNDVQVLGNGAEAINPTGFNETATISGKLLRLQYNFNEKYLFSASYRRDGSSRFSDENRYGDFWGFSAGWNIIEENFMQNVDWLDNLKLRASWAEVGNQDIASYAYIPTIESGVNYPFGPNEELSFGLIQRRFVDPNIKWETTISRNIGIDLAFLNNRLQFTADVYQNDKEDMLLQERLAPSTGTAQPRAENVYDVKIVNAGNMVNRGVELTLNWRDQTSYGLNYGIGTTFFKNENEVTDLNGTDIGYANGRPVLSRGENVDFTTFLAEGYEAGAFFLVQSAGIIKTQEELDEYRNIDSSAQLGDMRYIDQNGDGQIDDNDRVYSGSGQSNFELGLNFNLEFKGFDFVMQNYFSQGAEVYNGAKLYAYQEGRHAEQYGMWTPQNPDSNIPTDRMNAFHNNVRARSDYFLEDGTYWRIRVLTLGYTIPNTQKSGIRKFRIYTSALNPFTFTKYKGYDPEVGGDGIFTRGVDRGNYPVTRQFLLGAQISF